MLVELSDKNKVVGIKQTLKAVKNGSAKKVFVARDADERVVSPILAACKEQGISTVYADTMAELGKACGIEVGCAAAARI